MKIKICRFLIWLLKKKKLNKTIELKRLVRTKEHGWCIGTETIQKRCYTDFSTDYYLPSLAVSLLAEIPLTMEYPEIPLPSTSEKILVTENYVPKIVISFKNPGD